MYFVKIKFIEYLYDAIITSGSVKTFQGKKQGKKTDDFRINLERKTKDLGVFNMP